MHLTSSLQYSFCCRFLEMMVLYLFPLNFLYCFLFLVYSQFSLEAYDILMLLPCAINASCAALVDAGIPLKHLAVAICCGLTEGGSVILDPTKAEEQKIQAFAYLVFPNSPLSVLPSAPSAEVDGPIENGIITSVTHGVMPVVDYFNCLERGHAACAKISEFHRRSLESQVPGDLTKAT
ncbi:hypothetical protein C4D60_Mb04t18180 [Musa balbisiana]|uniref:Uncharacterized protein n=1 Tax=Musa balbisiana TaxID=52838 RepID=A0A4S8KCX0_MUSBA|nr:hypothetical protein C4D60_Mb04t18180 [Musa balbisiana]